MEKQGQGEDGSCHVRSALSEPKKKITYDIGMASKTGRHPSRSVLQGQTPEWSTTALPRVQRETVKDKQGKDQQIRIAFQQEHDGRHTHHMSSTPLFGLDDDLRNIVRQRQARRRDQSYHTPISDVPTIFSSTFKKVNAHRTREDDSLREEERTRYPRNCPRCFHC